MKHIRIADTEKYDAQALGLEGAAEMTVRLLSDDSVCIDIAPGGHTPDHFHEDKERVVIMAGTGEVRTEKGRQPVGAGDFLEFAENERHQLINSGDTTLSFICFRNQKSRPGCCRCPLPFGIQRRPYSQCRSLAFPPRFSEQISAAGR